MGPYRVDFDKCQWEQPAGGVRFKAFVRDGRRLRLVEFGEGFREDDWCRKGHIGMVLQGRLEVEFDGQVVTFGAGDGVFILAGEQGRHKARVTAGPVRLVLVEDV